MCVNDCTLTQAELKILLNPLPLCLSFSVSDGNKECEHVDFDQYEVGVFEGPVQSWALPQPELVLQQPCFCPRFPVTLHLLTGQWRDIFCCVVIVMPHLILTVFGNNEHSDKTLVSVTRPPACAVFWTKRSQPCLICHKTLSSGITWPDCCWPNSALHWT